MRKQFQNHNLFKDDLMKILITIFLILVSFIYKPQCGKMDIIILADYSASMIGNESKVISAIDDFINHLDIGINDIRVSIIMFNSTSRIIFKLTNDRNTIKIGINYLSKQKGYGTTKMEYAFMEASNIFSDESDYDTKKVLIIITDGIPDDRGKTFYVINNYIYPNQIIVCGVYIERELTDDYNDIFNIPHLSVIPQRNGEEFLNEITSGCYLKSDLEILANQLKKLNICL